MWGGTGQRAVTVRLETRKDFLTACGCGPKSRERNLCSSVLSNASEGQRDAMAVG